MKKILSLALSALVIFSTIAVYAKDAVAEEVDLPEMTEYLVENGIPEEFLADKEPDYITALYEKLYGQRFIFEESESVHGLGNYGDGVFVYGTIPEDELTLTVTKITNVVYDSSAHLDQIKEVYLTVSYEWETGHPYIRREDAITVNWDTSVFCLKSFESQDYKYLLSSGAWEKTAEYFLPATAVQGGLGYYTNLAYTETIMGQTVNALKCKGEALITLLPTSKTYHAEEEATLISCIYTHNTSLFPLSLSFTTPGGFSVGVDVPVGGADSLAYSLIYWYKRP